MASLQVDVPEVEEVSRHAEVTNSLETQENQNEEHDYVEEEEEDLENVIPNEENEDEPDDEDEDELLTGSQIIDGGGAKSTGSIELSDEDEADDQV